MAERYDVVIVGGGAVGSAVAYFLAADRDFDGSVLVVERDPTYEFCSSARATGGVRQQFSTPENIEMGLFCARFVKAIGDWLAVDGEAPDVGFREQGYLLLATPEAKAVMAPHHARQRALGADIEFVPAAELTARFPWLRPDGLAGGYFGARNEGWLDPYGLLQAFRKKARALGVRYVADEATGLSRDGERLTTVQLKDGGAVSAGVVVDAAGARDAAKVAAMAGVALPVEPRKRCAFIVDCRTRLTGLPLVIHPNGVWLRPEGTGYLCGVAPAAEADPANWDFEVDYALFEDTVWPTLAQYAPAFEALKLVRAYSCHYDFNTLDENAVLGRPPGLSNFYIATGFSGHGLMQSPAVGRAIAELIVHGAYRALDLSRFGYDRILTGEGIHEVSCF